MDTVTQYQAGLVGESYRKVRTGKFLASVVLEALALNLGMNLVEGDREGTIVSFDYNIHNDTKGGLRPGDKVKVLRKGMKLGHHVVLKADVAPAPRKSR